MRCDLGVGRAQRALLKLIGARSREDRVCVGVDEPGENDAAAGIDDPGIGQEVAFDLGARSDSGNAPVADAHGAVRDDGE